MSTVFKSDCDTAQCFEYTLQLSIVLAVTATKPSAETYNYILLQLK